MLRFWAQVVLIGIYLLHNALWKTRIFTTAGRSQSLHFWSNFGPNWPHEGVNIQKLRLYLVPILNWKYHYFLWYLGFFGSKNGLHESRIKRSENWLAPLHFFESPSMWSDNFGERILVIAHSNLTLFQLFRFFCLFWDPLFWLWACF